MQQKKYYASGKLMLSGEYAVLQGAEAIAIPTRYGQNLCVTENDAPAFLSWRAFTESDQLWLEADFDKHLNLLDSNSEEAGRQLEKILHAAFARQNPIAPGTLVETRLEFPRSWGLGSSSSLISLVAQWAKVDPMELFRQCLTGSGYDVAVAHCQRPLIYHLGPAQKPQWQEVHMPPIWKESYFLYLGEKQDSAREVSRFDGALLDPEAIAAINQYGQDILNANNLGDLQKAMAGHERLMSSILQRPTVQEQRFPDFTGQVKSLGAWGGDFAWVCCPDNPESYFHARGYQELIPFREMVLTREPGRR